MATKRTMTGALMAVALLAATPAAAQMDMGGDGMGDDHEHGHCPDDAEYAPLLSVADFDGSGKVGLWDIIMIALAVDQGEYIAIYDRNADLALDAWDILSAMFDWRASSTAFDRELVGLYHATKRYADRDVAIADGYRPFTQELAGHGQHYARMPILFTPEGTLDPDYENILDGNVDVLMPEGLNYDQDGELVAVFYYHGINVRDWVLANQTGNTAAVSALASQSLAMSLPPAPMPDMTAAHHEMWHTHWGPCWDGLDYVAMTFDPTVTPYFLQPLTQPECAYTAAINQGTSTPKVGWVPAFNMMHIWVHKLNRCGVFAGTDPDVSHMAEPEPFVQTFEEWMAKMMSGG